MSRKINVTRNINRVLLSDTLPYETPFIFSNKWFFDFALTYNQEFSALNKLLCGDCFTIPYVFSAYHTKGVRRKLSVIHPASQKRAVDLYNDYGNLILYFCSKSKISLRHPVKIAYKYLNLKINSECNSLDCGDDLSDQASSASTYFVNGPYSFLYQFVDSHEFHQLEKRFSHFCMLDVSKCFSSIYTHSIAWAIKGKIQAKKYRSAFSFERQFDVLMQRSNHDETHGIVVGPELSRIFAEIIFQRIDCDIVDKLERKIVWGREYEIRRYVDDFFVFYNTEEAGFIIREAISEALEEYKLYLNDSKTRIFTRPFISPETVAKIRVNEFIERWFESFEKIYKLKEKDYNIFDLNKINSNITITKFKKIICECGVDFDNISTYTLNSVLNFMNKFIIRGKYIERKDEVKIKIFLYSVIEFSFFIYSIDPKNRSSHFLCSIAAKCMDICKNQTIVVSFFADYRESELHGNMVNKIYSECVDLFKIQYKGVCAPPVENLNILITCIKTDIIQCIDFQHIYTAFDLPNPQINADSVAQLDYFSISVLIFSLAKLNLINSDIHEILIDGVNQKLGPGTAAYAEKAMLFLDILSCKYISKASRKKIFAANLSELTTEKCNSKKLFNFITSRNWFIDWEAGKSIESIIHEKDSKTPY